MTAEKFVPAVDGVGKELWSDEFGDVKWRPAGFAAPVGWHRLGWMQPVETPPHSDRREDGSDRPHLGIAGNCLCNCARCVDADLYCICPDCRRPDSSIHAHRPEAS
jgi:hypothetical protein